ncbi:hypothetical protein BSNK01_26940 [Bacillaceae bacterium]
MQGNVRISMEGWGKEKKLARGEPMGSQGKDWQRVIDFAQEREARQRAYCEAEKSFFQGLQKFAEQNVNLREKVRARHIFRALTGASAEELVLPRWEAQFESWFLLEYLNIKGRKILERYIEEKRQELNEAEITVAAHLLVTYPSVYLLCERRDDAYKLREIWREGESPVQWVAAERLGGPAAVGDYLFARIAKVGFIEQAVGTTTLLNEKGIPALKEQMRKKYEEFRKKTAGGSWRLFMQRYGVSALQWMKN